MGISENVLISDRIEGRIHLDEKVDHLVEVFRIGSYISGVEDVFYSFQLYHLMV